MSAIPIKRPCATQTDKAREAPALTVALLTEQELGSRWQISIKTLQRWRSLQTGPKFIKLENGLSVTGWLTPKPTKWRASGG